MLSAAPNVLIVHLQRIIFNFDTFRNDKINSYFEFPYHLDLKPYSFYHIMGEEGRLNKKKKNKEDGEPEEEEEDEETQVKDNTQANNEDNEWP